MARVTVEDCISYVRDRFELVVVAAQRSKELNHGTLPISSDVISKKNQEVVTALREIATGGLNIEMLKNSIVKKSTIETDIYMQKKDIGEIKQEVVENVESLKKEVSSTPQKKQIYQDEEAIEG